jgi:dolichol-phosphate mannosyltransferase
MLERYREGYDVVYGQRQQRRGESIFKRFTAWAFYRLMRVLADERLPLDCAAVRACHAGGRTDEVLSAEDAGAGLDSGDIVLDSSAPGEHHPGPADRNRRHRRGNPRSLLGWYAVPGWTSLMVVVSILGSALLISVGIVGQYVGRIYEQSKDRPLYLVARTFNVVGRTGPQTRIAVSVNE